MTNSAEQLLFRAATLLEESQDVEGALDLLHEALVLTQIAGRPLELIRVKTLLGDLLTQIEQPAEALKEFRDVVRLASEYTGEAADVDEELSAAREWIERLEPGH
jgi:hypothetical protein